MFQAKGVSSITRFTVIIIITITIAVIITITIAVTIILMIIITIVIKITIVILMVFIYLFFLSKGIRKTKKTFIKIAERINRITRVITLYII